MTARNEWTLTLPYPAPPLTLNTSVRMSWRKRHALEEQIRTDVQWLVKAAKIPRLTAVTIELVFYPKDGRVRDADNTTATLKPCLDGLVKAGVLDDDNSRHVLSTSQRIGDRRSKPVLLLIVRGTEAAHAHGAATAH